MVYVMVRCDMPYGIRVIVDDGLELEISLLQSQLVGSTQAPKQSP